MPKYNVNIEYVVLIEEDIEADSIKEAREIAWEIAEIDKPRAGRIENIEIEELQND